MYNFFSYNRFPEDYVYFFYLIELGFREKKKKKHTGVRIIMCRLIV